MESLSEDNIQETNLGQDLHANIFQINPISISSHKLGSLFRECDRVWGCSPLGVSGVGGAPDYV